MTRETELHALWLEKVEQPDLREELLSMQDDEAAVLEAFHQDLEFGTAGLRGIIGAGTNRMNVHTVGRATQGFADYLKANFEHPSVAIGRDSRNKGDEFVRRTAEVFAANGVQVYVYPRIEPTPAVSWAVRDLKCSGGVCMTASHNPAPYNGYKAYGPDGCQIATEAADAISASIADVDTFADVKTIDFDKAVEMGIVAWIGEDVLDRYIDAVHACSVADADAAQAAPLKVVYTPLNGTGLECVSRILERVGITDVTVVPEQAQPDGDFPTCPYPNPEIREALQKAIDLAEQVHPDLVLATDPDADRVGVAVKDGEDYTLLSGNEMGVLLLDYVARMTAAKGAAPLSEKVAVTTIVSSVMVDAIAQAYGFEVRRVLTGFKYIGGVIADLESEGRPDRFLFGFEESYGYLNGTHVRDKDAVDASMLICQMAQYYREKGMNLADAMRALYEQHGFFLNKTLAFSFPGVEGGERMKSLMADLRENPPAEIAGLGVEQVVDFAPGVASLPPANVIELDLEGSNKVIFRPSGTEPKVKAYLFAKRETRETAEGLLADLEAAVRSIVE